MSNAQNLKAIQQAQTRKAMQAFSQGMQFVQQASKLTFNKISLPIYPGSEVVMHIDNVFGIEVAGNKLKALPSATFYSMDGNEKIFKYYRLKLPNFKYKKLGKETIIFMESMPDNFDLLTHMDMWLSTPHIILDKASPLDGVVPDNARTKIEIGYRPEL